MDVYNHSTRESKAGRLPCICDHLGYIVRSCLKTTTNEQLEVLILLIQAL